MVHLLEDKVKEFSESGHLETQLLLENQLIEDLKYRLLTIDPKDHLQFVSVRGMLEGLFRLQERRNELTDEQS